MLTAIKNFLFDLLFPSFCINCGREGSYLCEDCQSLIEISDRQYCPFCKFPKVVITGKTCKRCRKAKKLNGLYSATSYDNFVVKKLINQFKYPPYIRELAKPLSSLIATHLSFLNPSPNFNTFIMIPIPLHKKKQNQRGFNPAEEIGKELSLTLKMPLFDGILIKTKQTLAQVELKKEEREKNIRGVFFCQEPELIRERKILLIDDIFTTGSTMEECARTLKANGAKEVWGVVAARG